MDNTDLSFIKMILGAKLQDVWKNHIRLLTNYLKATDEEMTLFDIFRINGLWQKRFTAGDLFFSECLCGFPNHSRR
ncbi:MAG: hypothetical protein ACT6FC_05325 [Methanosarcinaceae archaeon]